MPTSVWENFSLQPYLQTYQLSIRTFFVLLPQAAVTIMAGVGMDFSDRRAVVHTWRPQTPVDVARRLPHSEKPHCRGCAPLLMLSGPKQSTHGDACRQ